MKHAKVHKSIGILIIILSIILMIYSYGIYGQHTKAKKSLYKNFYESENLTSQIESITIKESTYYDYQYSEESFIVFDLELESNLEVPPVHLIFVYNKDLNIESFAPSQDILEVDEVIKIVPSLFHFRYLEVLEIAFLVSGIVLFLVPTIYEKKIK